MAIRKEDRVQRPLNFAIVDEVDSVLLDEAEQDLEAMRELRYEPEYYQDYRKMEELDAKIDDKHNEIAALMKEWEEKMAMME